MAPTPMDPPLDVRSPWPAPHHDGHSDTRRPDGRGEPAVGRASDRDAIYGEAFRRRVAGMGISEVITSPSSPWQNPYAERLIGSIRRECLDHVIVLGERQGVPRRLRRMLFVTASAREASAASRDGFGEGRSLASSICAECWPAMLRTITDRERIYRWRKTRQRPDACRASPRVT